VSVVAVVMMVLGFVSAPAGAAASLDLTSLANTTAAPGGTVDYFVTIANVGDQATDGSPLTFQMSLPAGLSAVSVGPFPADVSPVWDCSGTSFPASTVSCTNPNVLDAHRNAMLKVTASVDRGALGTLTASASVSGGGAAGASTVDPVRIAASPPGFGISAFEAQMTADAQGDPFTQAGAHPAVLRTSILFNTTTNPKPLFGETWPVEPTKDIVVNLPPGVITDPTVAAKCTAQQIAGDGQLTGITQCPADSQIGVTSLLSTNGAVLGNPLAVFNMVPPPGVPARFGFNVLGTVVTIDGSVRSSGDYGLTATVRDASEALALSGTTLTLWGVPADPSHTFQRSCPGQLPVASDGPSCGADGPLRAFLRAPTSCTAPGVGLVTTLDVDSWFDPGVFQTSSSVSHDLPGFPADRSDWGAPVGISGCGAVPFAPGTAGAPGLPAAGAPSAFSFDLTVPQSDDPAPAIGTSDLRKAVVTLPAGLRTSASAAYHLEGCSEGQIALHSDVAPTCPGASQIGTVSVVTPLLDVPLTGSVYLASPHENPFGSLLAIYLSAEGSGARVKLAGEIRPDPRTGQLTTVFDNQPQLPFSKLHLAFFGGPRAPLSVPAGCGIYTSTAVLTGWSGKTVSSTSTFRVSGDGHGGPCGPVFAPKISAGTTNVHAGRTTSLAVRLTRADSDQDFSYVRVDTPRGVTGKIAGVPLCPDANATLGTCPAASRIGTVLTGAGAGPDPFYLPGKVFFTGPYRGAPFGLSIVVRAIAGPFDLGTVVVRSQVRVDRHTAQLHVIADPLPQILQGIPLGIKDIRIAVNRPHFMINPTSCTQKRVKATFVSAKGTIAHATDRFQVGGCAKLPLHPKLSLTVGGKGQDRRGNSTSLTATLTQTPGQANLRSVFVSLPATLNARLGVVQAACTQAQYLAGNCENARAGSALAITPLLDQPLRGSVYFVKDPKKRNGALPNLVVALRGQVSFDLIGHITLPGNTQLATDFNAIPDVPITTFRLSLLNGTHGPLGTLANLCSPRARKATATIAMRGQNGTLIQRHQHLHVRGCN
jgi:uncharacterized repeat protein (TIGR01451 family)